MNLHESLLRPFSRWDIEPYADESSLGYFRRLVAREQHSSARVYAQEIGLAGRYPNPSELLASLSSLPMPEEWKSRLRRASPLPRGKLISVAGETLRPRQLSVGSMRYCPGCLYESAYDRVWWSVLAIRTCPFHDAAITNIDSEGRVLGWWWPHVAESPSGLPLARRCAPSPHLGKSFAAYLVGRLGFAERIPGPLLDALPLHDAIEAWNFASFLVAADSGGHEMDVHGSQLGYEMLTGSFGNLVDSIRRWVRDNVPQEVRERGFDVVFPAANVRRRTYLSRRLSRLFGDAMKKGVAAANRRVQKTYTDADARGEELGVLALAARMGIQQKGLSAVAIRAGVMPERIWSRARVHFSLDEAAKIRAFVEQLVTYSEAATLLGLPHYQIKPFVDMGLLWRVAGASRNGVKAYRVCREDIERLLKDAIQPLPVVSAKGTISLVTAASQLGLEAGKLAALAASGAVRPAGRLEGAPKLRFLRFDKAVQLARDVPTRTPVDSATKTAQRRRAIVLYAEEVGVEAACQRYGMFASTLRIWQLAFAQNGFEGLRRLKYHAKHPHTKTDSVREMIVDLALRHPKLGCDRLSAILAGRNVSVSSATVQKVLMANGLGRQRQRVSAAGKAGIITPKNQPRWSEV